VISESLARRYFPGENPLGRHIKAGKAEAEGEWMTVVGVVNDVRYSWIVKDDVPRLPLVPAGAPVFHDRCATHGR